MDLANRRALRRPQQAPATRAALGVIQGGWWTQEVANKAGASDHPPPPPLFEVRTCSVGISDASTVDVPDVPRCAL